MVKEVGVLTLTLLMSSGVSLASDDDENGKLLEFQTMVGATAPFIGPAGAIDGVVAAPLPWSVTGSIKGELKTNGALEIKVEGLVLANDPSVPANLRLTNPVPAFSAVVTCRTNVNGQQGIVRVTTANFPADSAGNSKIEATVALPKPCVAPVIFVTSPNGGVWFAATGH
jgi:hypothetical protein